MDRRLLEFFKVQWLSTELLWSLTALALVALAVQITGKGIDLLALMTLGVVIVIIDNALGDKVSDVVGPTGWSVMLLTLALLSGWALVQKNGVADRFFRSAKHAGYETLYYDSSVKPHAPGAPHDTQPTVEEPAPPTVVAKSSQPLASRTETGPAPVGGSGTSSAGLGTMFTTPTLAPWRRDVKKPVLRVEAPEIAATGAKIKIRALLTLDGAPISGASITFTADNRVITAAATDRRGSATATFAARAPAQYQLRALFEGSGELREASAAAVLHVIPGK